MSTPELSVGIVGAGPFAACFIPLFAAHPGVRSVALAERDTARREEACTRFGVDHAVAEAEELIADAHIDAIAIFTDRTSHAPLSLRALQAGKHVYSAVPAGQSLDEIADLVEAVASSGLTYMMGETSLYYPTHLYCRRKYDAGAFGDFVYGEGDYDHDLTFYFYDVYTAAHGERWREYLGIPPMHYPTHSTSMILGITGARATKVSCFGYRDRSDDGVYGEGRNFWDNPWSNQSALMQTSDGGMLRLNEFRRCGHHEDVGNGVRMKLVGTRAIFEEQAFGRQTNRASFYGLQDPLELLEGELLSCMGASVGAGGSEDLSGDPIDGYYGISPVHPTSRLPDEFRGQPNGHFGSHQFLVDDFVRAVTGELMPPANVWASARFNAPGLVAHESCKQGGDTLHVPDFGAPPAPPFSPFTGAVSRTRATDRVGAHAPIAAEDAQT